MSIAVAVRKGRRIAIAADTQTNFGDGRVATDNHRAAKIMRVGEAWLAMAGWGLYENLLVDYLARRKATPRLGTSRDVFRFFVALWKGLREDYTLVNDQAMPREEERSPFADLDASFLIVSRRGIQHVASNLSVTAFERYYAIGSGTEYALGAVHALYGEPLDAKTVARRACEAAICFDTSCGGEIDVREIVLPPSR